MALFSFEAMFKGQLSFNKGDVLQFTSLDELHADDDELTASVPGQEKWIPARLAKVCSKNFISLAAISNFISCEVFIITYILCTNY